MSTQTTERPIGCLKAGDVSLPLIKMEIAGAITGLLHRTKVNQTFVNDHSVPLEAVYIHPLPPKASVHGFRLVIGSRVVEGVVQERGQARQAYQQAVAQGQRAALMEQERSDIFTTTVGNIAPGEQVTVSFELSGPLEFLGSTARLHFPLVVPEVYIPGDGLPGGAVGDGTAVDTHSVPDASRITPPRLAEGAANPVNLRLSFTVDPAGLELEEVDSLCHFARTRRRDDGLFEISLLPGMERLEHDFVVRLKLKEGSLQSTLVSDPRTGTFALTVVPPLGSGKQVAPRDIVIVLDRSGSMEGWCMTAAKRAATRIVESLTPHDRFGLIAFDNSCELLDPWLVPADARQQERAQEFLAGIEARGGTEACPAIERALQLLKTESSSDKTVLFITDGDVGNDSELVARSSGGVRISTVGIGSNSRAGVLESMARTSGGLCSLIPEESTLEESLRDLHQRLGRPHWMGLSLTGVEIEGQAPRFWDVWEGVPATFFGKASSLGSEVTVEGWLASTGRHSQPVMVLRRDDLVIHRSWARARLLDLDDLWTIGKAQQNELVELSVEAQVLCRFTAFTAIDSSEVVAGSENLRSIVQPVERTLRSAAPAKKLAQAPGSVLGRRMSRASSPMSAPAPAPAAPPALVQPAPLPAPPARLQESCDDLVDTLSSSACQVPEERTSLELAGAAHSKSETFKESPAPSPRAEMPISEKSIWARLLEMMDSWHSAPSSAKSELLEKMIEALSAHCRQLAAGHPEEIAGKEAMSLLLDLRQSLENGEEGASTLAELRSTLEARSGLN